MWTCQVVKNGKTYLGRHLVANDYYDEGNQVVGRWVGRASRILGIEGQEIRLGDAHFESLRTNIHPTLGGPLTQRTGEERRAFFDFQISAPKSVSIMAVTFGDERLRLAHEEAVTASFKELEKFAARRERGGEAVKRKESVFTGNLVSARFTHDSSRNLDAQLHTHVVTANATYDEKTEKWYALENGEMFRAVGYAGRVYQSVLAMRVKALGYEIEEDRENGKIRGFEIIGVTEEDRAKQSTRRAEIETAIDKFRKEKGREPTAAETHVMAVETRSKKLAEISTDAVREQQLGKYDAHSRARLEFLIPESKSKSSRTVSEQDRKRLAQEAVEFAINHRFERDGVLSLRELATTAIEENLGTVGFDEIHSALLENPELVRLGHVGQEPLETTILTTREYLESEEEAIKLVSYGIGKFDELGQSSDISQELAQDQRNAVLQVLSSKDAVTALRGPAGAGKTFTLKELDKLLKSSGREAVFIAPTHAAKSVLQKDGFNNAETVSQFMASLSKNQRSLEGKVLIVDEAGMLSAKQGFSLLKESLSQGARVLLVGDEKQLLSVEAGDFLGNLRKHSAIQIAELTEIRRQQETNYRSAMQEMSQGKLSKGLEILDRDGRVIEGKGDYLKNSVKSYFGKIDSGQSALIVSPTWKEIDKINNLVRKERKLKGELKGDQYFVKSIDLKDWTKAQKGQAKLYKEGMMISSWKSIGKFQSGEWSKIDRIEKGNLVTSSGEVINVKQNYKNLIIGEEKEIPLQAGDKILIQGNDKRTGLKNGSVVTVSEISQDHSITVKSADGEIISIPKGFSTFSHGYAVTPEKSQGATVDSVIVAGAKISGRRIYVSTSRGRKSVEVHVPDKSELILSAKKGIEQRKIAMDKVKKSKSHKLYRERSPSLLSRNIVWERWDSWILKIKNFMRTHLGFKKQNSITHELTR